MNPSTFASYAIMDPIDYSTLPYAEAVAAVRKTRKRVWLKVGTQVWLACGTGTNTPGVLLAVTKKQALTFLADSVPEHWRPKVSLRVGVSKRCMFLGSSPR